nr:transposase [Arthrobacter sp. H5]
MEPLWDKGPCRRRNRTAPSSRRRRRTERTAQSRANALAGRTPPGGRPPSFDPAIYKDRNTVERGFNRLKHWRGIATRFDKYATTFLGGLLLTATLTFHRVHN